MNLHIIGIIIKREYLNKVKKKSFLITTFVVPILMAALCVVPVVLMLTSKEKLKKVAVVDRSGIVMPFLTDTETIDYVDYSDFVADTVKNQMKLLGLDAVLSISEITSDKSVDAEITSLNPLGMGMSENISNRIDDAVEAYRISTYDIAGLDQIMKDVKSDVKLHAYTMDDSGKIKLSNAGVNSAISMVLGIIIFLFITLFGGMVMTAVIEEKSSRVVEVLISSVKATELMFGKIIGVAGVALTQFLLWVVLTAALVGGAFTVLGPKVMGGIDAQQIAQSVSGMNSLPDGLASMAEDVETVPTPKIDGELQDILGTIQGLPITKIVVYFLIFFILGYLLYATLYAAIGSAVENEGDSQQLQMPVTIPLMLAYFIALYAFNAPDSAIAVWGSMIPFTAPIVMLARIPFGVPDWQIIISILVTAITVVGCTWVSAKIYKVGILMYGKKTTFKDLLKWLKMK